jgi:sirohydrochlorin cobaltochelatase
LEQKAILVVSFGTTNLKALKNNIEACEKSIGSKFAGYEIRRAFTSKIIKKNLFEKNGLDIDIVDEALTKLKKDDFKIVIIQPLHIIPGKEYHEIFESVQEHKKFFNKILIGKPLLNSIEDYDLVINAVNSFFKAADKDQAIILMGHGTIHPANACYSCLQLKLDDKYENIFIATVEGYPELDNIIPKLKLKKIKKAILMPFMIVAGEHAANDMSGDNEDSWKNVLKSSGFEVEILMIGLGEIKGIQDIYIKHISDMINNN